MDQLILPMIQNEELKRAYMSVNREDFLPEKNARFAYDPEWIDKPIPLNDRVNMTALSLGIKMLDYLNLKRGERVLEVGTGSGYYTAIIAEVVGSENVTTVEVDPWVSNFASVRLSKYNIKVETTDGTIGFPKKAPYQRAIIWAAMPTMPCLVYEQLEREGILIVPIGTQKVQNLYRITKGDQARMERLETVIFMRAQGLCGFYD
ncbi:protein-L-isoaspartate O-methyltransferase family protein [Metallosphaera tengchongensis]|uniref:protein-L-isoaspartate O-methyltransferase family protein n=1 Tax=Metallosphaera tengchongensis TaxID=1532350 RepID=UPI001FE2F473|nr:protein-L-isoaspartate O-methyltransferase [Metallosphaera tengchongensis]